MPPIRTQLISLGLGVAPAERANASDDRWSQCVDRHVSSRDLTSVCAVAIESQLDSQFDVPLAVAMTPQCLASKSLLRALALIAVGTGCATLAPPARSTGAALSEEGIEIAIVGQFCKQSRGTSASRAPSLDETLVVEVGNPTPDPVSVDPDKLILITPGGGSVRGPTPAAAGPLSVDGGTTVPVTLHFTVTGANCSQEMQLDAGSSLQWQGRRVTVSAIRFVPIAPG